MPKTNILPTWAHFTHQQHWLTLSLCCLMFVFQFDPSMANGQETGTATLDRKAMQRESSAKQKEASKENSKEENKGKDGWIPLLPQKGLENWEITDFGLPGKVSRDGDMLVVEAGDPLNGITYTKKSFPKDNFEISLEAKRVEGNDFLCGLTFPVGKDGFCSLIAGGWGGGLVGLSNVDGFDASENSTTTYSEFENNKWYKFKVRVDQEFIRAWIDDEEYFRQDREGHEFSTRIEVYSSQPLGFCSFQSKVLVRDFKWRSTRIADKLAKREAEKARREKGGSRSSPGTAAEPIQ